MRSMLVPLLTTTKDLLGAFEQIHDRLRSTQGLHPPEALDELLEFISAAIEERAPVPHHVSVAEASYYIAQLRSLRVGDSAADVRGAAFNAFIHSRFRRGLGIYLTPDPVVEAAISVLPPGRNATVCDPACGSGSFLLKVSQHWHGLGNGATGTLIANDISARMLRIAQVNLSGQGFDTRFSSQDAFAGLGGEGLCDLIYTNPPFGIRLPNLNQYVGVPRPLQAVPELLFLWRCLELLRPGGKVAIVLPNSVLNSKRLSDARASVCELGEVEGAIKFPSETFAVTGTQSNVSLVFMRRYVHQQEARRNIRFPVETVVNVGYDSTGRLKAGSDVQAAVLRLKTSERQPLTLVKASESLSKVYGNGSLVQSPSGRSVKRLGDLVDLASNGTTPPKAAYGREGQFIIKVGNLTGSGIDWLARENNRVSLTWGRRRKLLTVQAGDVLLTSSAHSPIYIGKKVDVVDHIPNFVGTSVTFVGEIMLLRCNSKVDPFVLAAILRCERVGAQLRSLVRGQTAHLYPEDVQEIAFPSKLLAWAIPVASLLRDEAARSKALIGARRKVLLALDEVPF
jgi:type I restriction enzyme M protein